MLTSLSDDGLGQANVAATASGHIDSFYDSGMNCACSIEKLDLIEAHKWFNLAATSGDARGATARGSVALDMTPREITEAQRRARSFLTSGSTRSAH